MTALHMLDTDMSSYVIKRRSPELERKLALIPPASVCVSVMTRAELLYGLKRLPPEHRLHWAVRQFLRIVRALPWTADAADHYADIRHHLAQKGQLVGEMDMMIAAHSMAAGAILVSNNLRHFQRIPAPLSLVNWLE